MPILKDPKREKFCLLYAQSDKRAWAYQEAGYGAKSYNVAKSAACRLLQDPEVAARMAELRAEQFRRIQMQSDEILGRLAAIARGDARLLYDEEDGSIKRISDLTLEEACMIQEITETVTPGGRDANGKALPDTVTTKVKLRDPIQALRMLAQNKKLIGSDADEAMSNLASAFADRMTEARKRRAGGK